MVCNKPCRQVDLDRVMTTGSLDGVMASTVAYNARDMGSIPAPDGNISYFHHPTAFYFIFLF